MIDPEIVEAIDFVYSYASSVDDWITIKKELLKCLHPSVRTQFSTRDPITKKQRTNDLEREIAQHWSTLTGREVVFK